MRLRELRRGPGAQELAKERLLAAWDRLDRAAERVRQRGVELKLVPARPSGAARMKPAELMDALASELERSAAELDELAVLASKTGFQHTGTTDVGLFQSLFRRVRGPEALQAEARTLAEVVDLWLRDPKLTTYQVELLEPYAEAVKQLATTARDHTGVEAARLALGAVQRAQAASASYLLRRTANLDGFHFEKALDLARLRHPPALALERMDAAIRQARGLGPVDFFQNLLLAARDAARTRGAVGGVMAWTLSDVTVALLTQERVRAWLSDGQG